MKAPRIYIVIIHLYLFENGSISLLSLNMPITDSKEQMSEVSFISRTQYGDKERS